MPKTATVNLAGERNVMPVELGQTSSTIQTSTVGLVKGGSVQVTSPSMTLFQLAYKKWSEASPSCSCEFHGNILEEPNKKCQRDYAWKIYCKLRNGMELSTEERLFLDLN